MEYEIDNSIAFLQINASPFVATRRKELVELLNHANDDQEVKYIALIANGKHFSTGLSTLDYFSGDSLQKPTVNDVASCLERSCKPVISVLSGKAMSAGLEAALGCQYRIAGPDAQIGFPEIRFGLIPNGGASQRLPRIIGLQNALGLIVTGKYISANQALKLGLVDETFTDVDVKKILFEFVKKIDFDDIHVKMLVLKSVSGQKDVKPISKNSILAKHCAVKAVINSTKETFHNGIVHEQEIFLNLLKSDEFKSFVYISRAERKTYDWQVQHRKIDFNTCKPKQIKSAGVVGLGTMGSGIATAMVMAGIPVTVLEQNPVHLENGVRRMHNMISETGRRGMVTQQQQEHLKNLIFPISKYSDFKDCDVVVEAVFEKMDVKRVVFENLDKFCKPSAILFTNTSALNIDEIAAFTKRPHKVMGTHFFAPSHIMKLLENIHGVKTDAETLATGMHLGQLLNKVTVLVGNCTGFVGNRMYVNYMNECDSLLEEGLYPREVDRALESYGLTFGRYYVADLSGIDVQYFVYQNIGQIDSNFTPTTFNQFTQALYNAGRYGQKAGAGYYDYTKEAPTVPLESKFVRDTILKIRRDKNITLRKFSEAEIVERALYSLINEGFKILEEGIATSAMDVDLVWVHGYAWPRSTGGPMYYAYTRGLSHVCERIKYYYGYFNGTREHWAPSKMLMYLAGLDQTPQIEHWVALWRLAKL